MALVRQVQVTFDSADPERVGVARGDVAHVQHDPAAVRHGVRLALGEEAVGDAALVEDLDGPRVEATGS